MKKRLLALLSALLLLLSLGSAARADDTMIVNLGTAEAGVYTDRLLGTTGRGAAAVSAGALPEGCAVVTETGTDGARHYLRGTPTIAGSYEFTLSVTDAAVDPPEQVASLVCSLEILPGTPSVGVSPDLTCAVGEEALLTATASVADGGTLSYQWYASPSGLNQDGELIPGASEATLRVTPEAAGTSRYYCVVTNTNNGRTVSVASPVAAVKAVQQVRPVSLTIVTMPVKLEYLVGEELETAGLQLLVSYSDGRTEQIGTGFTASPARLESVGVQSVTVSYAGLICSYSVQVKEQPETVLELQIIDLPQKLTYELGDWLDTTGMTLRVETNRGSYEVTTGYSCSPRTLSVEGRQAITVTYGSHSATFYVEVRSNERRVESIVVTRRPARLSYTVGDYFDPLGLTLTVQTNRGAEEVSDGFVWMPQQFTYAGRQEVTIIYEGKTCTLEIIVDEAAETAAPIESAQPEETSAPEPTPAATPRPDTRLERRSGHTAVVVIAVAALVGLAALTAYVILAKKEALAALWARLRRGSGKK